MKLGLRIILSDNVLKKFPLLKFVLSILSHVQLFCMCNNIVNFFLRTLCIFSGRIYKLLIILPKKFIPCAWFSKNETSIIFPKKLHFRFWLICLQWWNHVGSRYMELMHFNDALKSISVENQARSCDIESEFDIFF